MDIDNLMHIFFKEVYDNKAWVDKVKKMEDRELLEFIAIQIDLNAAGIDKIIRYIAEKLREEKKKQGKAEPKVESQGA